MEENEKDEVIEEQPEVVEEVQEEAQDQPEGIDKEALEEASKVGELQVGNLYNEYDNDEIEEFYKELSSSLDISVDYDKTEFNLEWLTIMEDTIRYIDNILRNPNRFIVNEEDIVKIELARRVTVESIKHLSRNTNLIQEYDKETGDIKPSKILNINKEESYNTYENRFIYSLIQNMKTYVMFKKKGLESVSSAKDDKKLKFSGTTRVGKTKYEISINLTSSLDSSVSQDENSLENVMARIEKLENRITDLTSSEVYKTINKLHIALVTSPIKKTNVILKNTNFQYAVKLWNYMQEHMNADMDNIKDSKSEKVEGKVKKYSDEVFLLEHLILESYINSDTKKTKKQKKEVSKKIVNSMLQRLLEMDSIDKKEILDLIDKYYTVIKYKSVVNDKEIFDKFKTAIKNYKDRFNSVEIE